MRLNIFVLSVKYLAYYSCWMCTAILLRDFWDRLSKKNLSNKRLFMEFLTQAFVVVNVPTIIYVTTFYTHLEILTKAGVHDSLMTSAFQVGNQ